MTHATLHQAPTRRRKQQAGKEGGSTTTSSSSSSGSSSTSSSSGGSSSLLVPWSCSDGALLQLIASRDPTGRGLGGVAALRLLQRLLHWDPAQVGWLVDWLVGGSFVLTATRMLTLNAIHQTTQNAAETHSRASSETRLLQPETARQQQQRQHWQ
jgi:hypothetical protein